MTDLINTVRNRYGRGVSFRGLTTLTYRTREEPERGFDTAALEPRYIIGFLQAQIKSVSSGLHGEINKMLERRDKLLLQNVARDMPIIVGKNTAKLRADSIKAEKEQAEKTVRLQKRVELLSADTGAKLKAVQRELERLKTSDKNRVREEERTARERLLTTRNEQRRESRDAEQKREELRREFGAGLIRTERRITQKLRDDEEYEKRRRG